MMKWISVEKQKPPIGERVIICGKRGGINIGRLDYEDDDNMICVEKGNVYRGYTHWMPLPNLPEGVVKW